MATAHFLAALLCTLICWSGASITTTTTKQPTTTKPAPKLPKAIETFNDVFKKELKNCSLLTEMFDVDFYADPNEFEAAKFYLSSSLVADLGSKNVVKDAENVVRYIPDNSKKLGDDLMIAVYSDSLAKYLYGAKILNCKNAEKLAKLYAKQNKETYKKVANIDYHRSQILSLCVAYVQFLVKQFGINNHQGSVISKTYGNEWKYQDKIGAVPKADRRYPEIRSPVDNELLKPWPKDCKTSKATQQFANSLSKLAQSSTVLSNLFKVGSPADVHRGVTYVSQFVLQRFDVENSAILADFMAKYVDEKKARDPAVLCRVFAHAAGKHLESKKILNSKNANKLSHQYAKALEEAAKRISQKDNARSKIVALLFGMTKFLNQLNAFQAKDGKNVAYFYGNEWYCHTRDYVKLFVGQNA